LLLPLSLLLPLLLPLLLLLLLLLLPLQLLLVLLPLLLPKQKDGVLYCRHVYNTAWDPLQVLCVQWGCRGCC
jgi:hypothetical protein